MAVKCFFSKLSIIIRCMMPSLYFSRDSKVGSTRFWVCINCWLYEFTKVRNELYANKLKVLQIFREELLLIEFGELELVNKHELLQLKLLVHQTRQALDVGKKPILPQLLSQLDIVVESIYWGLCRTQQFHHIKDYLPFYQKLHFNRFSVNTSRWFRASWWRTSSWRLTCPRMTSLASPFPSANSPT